MDTEVTFVAGARLLIGETYREIGELVPEAEFWSPHAVHAMVVTGQLARAVKVTVEKPCEECARRGRAERPAPVVAKRGVR